MADRKAFPTPYINHDMFFFPPLPLSRTLILTIKRQSLFIYFPNLGSEGLEWRSEGVGEGETADRGGGGKLCLVHKTHCLAELFFYFLLFSSSLCCELVVQ